MSSTRVAAVVSRPTPDDPPPDLGWALTTLLRGYGRAVEAVLADLPGGGRAYRLLAASASAQMPTQLALAESAGLDRTVVTYLVDDLAAAGLVERRPDPADRRVRRVVLTDHGIDRLAEFERRLRQVEQQVLAPLGEADSAQLRVLLDRAANALRPSHPVTCALVTAVTGSGCDGLADPVADAGRACGSPDPPC